MNVYTYIERICVCVCVCVDERGGGYGLCSLVKL